jgi:(p)ppGpp synthase/HD superfamily hydrolase
MNYDKALRAEEFARRCHAGQVRKGAAQEPYTVHLEEVASFVASEGGSESAICAAWLHDTVEDCPPTSFEDIEAEFGNVVADIVRELTDDKSLDKAERKQLQIINAAHKSEAACLVKIADKTSNLRSLANSPPPDWDYQRRSDYVVWAAKVVSSLAHQPEGAIQKFLNAVDAAEIANAQNCLSTRQAQAVALRALQRKALRAGATPEQTKQFLAQFLADTLINN